METYIKKCKGLGEIPVVELAEIEDGARAKERELATVGKRIREVGDGQLDLASSYVDLRSTRRRVLIEATTGSVSVLDGCSPSCAPVNSFEEANCDFKPSRFCSNDASSYHVEYQGTISDPEGQPNSGRVGTLTFYGGGSSRGRTSASLAAEESSDVESTAGRPWTAANCRGGPTVHEMPSEFEIEEFFTAAEQDLQKRFSEKYNFDTIKGVPLEGRYEWVPADHEWS